MVLINTLTDAHEVSLEMCENIRDWLKIFKVWTTKKNELDKEGDTNSSGFKIEDLTEL